MKKLFSYRLENNIIHVDTTLAHSIPENGLGDFMFHQMKKYKDRVAQYEIYTGEQETHASLLLRSVRTAIEMRSRGIKEGDIITINTYNNMDAIVPFIAAQFLGAIVASLDPIITKEDSEYLLTQVEPKMMFISDNVADTMESIVNSLNIETIIFGQSKKYLPFSEFTTPKANEATFMPVKVDNTKTAVIFFSSGTTGLPKGIEAPHKELFHAGINFKSVGCDLGITFNLASLYWVSSVACLVGIIDQGGSKLNCKTCSPKDVWSVISKYKATYAFFSTSYAFQVAKAGRPADADASSMKNAVIAGGPISEENLQTVRDAFHDCNIIVGYGQTEVGFISSFKAIFPEEMELMKTKGNSAGRPLPGSLYKIVDPATNETLGPNQPGELRIKTEYQMNGYYRQDSSGAWDEDGWIRTGDVVYYDEDFCFYVIDRIKEMLKFQSWHVTPAKIEGVLLSHPGVAEAVVIGIPHAEDGDHPMAVVVQKDGGHLTCEELIKYVEERVDDKHRLRGGVQFMDKLPQTPTGKVKRKELKQLILKI